MLSYIWLEIFLVCANMSSINLVGLCTYSACFACSSLLFFLYPNPHLSTRKPDGLKPLSFPVISVVFLFKAPQPSSLKAGGVRWLQCSGMEVP